MSASILFLPPFKKVRNFDENGLEEQPHTDGITTRKGEASKKILSFMSLSQRTSSRQQQQQKRKSAKNATSPSTRRAEKLRKEKPSARKERKATQTLAIVLGNEKMNKNWGHLSYVAVERSQQA